MTTNKPKKLLIITSSGGGGLLQTANAKQQQALAKDPTLTIIKRDLLKDWIWTPIGNYFINFWNNSQKKGSMLGQKICVFCQTYIDYLLHPIIFFYALYTVFKEDVDHVIDTQPLGTSAIIKALRIFNRVKQKHVRLEKVLVDLPTKKATHFFSPIKKLSKNSRPLLQLTTIAPLLEDGETAEDFWQQTCGLSDAEINYEDAYVRQAFFKYKGKPRASKTMSLTIRYQNDEEQQLMRQSFKRGPIRSLVKSEEIEFFIEPEDRVFTVLLGSQPAKRATLNYAKNAIAVAKENPKAKIHLFIFCANHKQNKETLFKGVSQFVDSVTDYPLNLSIVPFSFQKEDVIAPLFFRSDVTCTRSGGQTAMELMSVSTGEIWIHSEAKPNQNLIEGISGWEAASALYLQKIHGAKIVTTSTFNTQARRLFQGAIGCDEDVNFA
ncbi:MAG: hypothetical protein COT85_01580 [Chlamydiae bacterium CG10_big_fil_rev_8_21_14_0_10_42_34]|nr:MAG: hypothetical protein COT85_01580 [Chlamydiae bacterium CG10_big_fil_rev_8_21_14_0_10_42_34]